MALIDHEQLEDMVPFASDRLRDKYFLPLNRAMEAYEINTPLRIAAFIAQIIHESGSLNYTKEIASGVAYDTGSKAIALGNTPEADGDGQKYKGRGLIQLTGKANYEKCGAALGLDLIAHPELLEEPTGACLSAAWFWKTHGCNELADVGNFSKITKVINGGFNGATERAKYYNNCKKVLDCL